MPNDDIYPGFFPVNFSFQKMGVNCGCIVELLFKCLMTTSTLVPPVTFFVQKMGVFSVYVCIVELFFKCLMTTSTLVFSR
jgi:hypothetical protein